MRVVPDVDDVVDDDDDDDVDDNEWLIFSILLQFHRKGAWTESAHVFHCFPT